MKDRWILVDVGQVLIGFDHGVIGRRLLAECFPVERQSAETLVALETFVLSSTGGLSRNHQIDRGLRSVSWLRAELCGEFKVDIAEEKFEEIWTSIFRPQVNHDVVASVDAWRGVGAQIGICSNTNVTHWNFLRREHADFRRLTDAARCFLSFEMGEGKGDPGFFERIARTTGAPLEHHLLLDDVTANCDAARAAGMLAVLFAPTNVAESLQAVERAFQGGAS